MKHAKGSTCASRSSRRARPVPSVFFHGSTAAKAPYEAAPEDIAALARPATLALREFSFGSPATNVARYQEHIVRSSNASSGHIGLVRVDGTHRAAGDAYVAETMRHSPCKFSIVDAGLLHGIIAG